VRRPDPTSLFVSLALLLTASLQGCASSPYEDIQEHWTRDADGYEELEARALVAATLKTAPFRPAYVPEYPLLFEPAP